MYGLGSEAGAGDLLALAFDGDTLIVINCSPSDLDILFSEDDSVLVQVFPLGITSEVSAVICVVDDRSLAGNDPY